MLYTVIHNRVSASTPTKEGNQAYQPMPFKVINTQHYFTNDARTCLEKNDCEIIDDSLSGITEDDFCRTIHGIDAVIAGSERYTQNVFRAADKLKIIARTGAGYDQIDLQAATKNAVWVTTTPGAGSHAVSDFTLGLILCLLRNIPAMAQEMKNAEWKQFAGRELSSMTLGVIGAGAIGQEVIKKARGFGASVLAFDIYHDHDFAENWQIRYVPLDELMAQSDIVTLHTALNEHTQGLIDERRLNLMKKDAFLVNTSRPDIVVKDALIRVLKEKRIAGAAIDVHDPAPCAPGDALVQLDNVIATPWTAYKTEEAIDRMCDTAVNDILTVFSGGAPRFPVNEL